MAIFGLRKIGKSSLLRRLEDVLAQDQSSICATATLIGNSTRITTGRWWNLAQDVVSTWQSELHKLATALGSKVYAKAERLKALVAKRETSQYELATAFERDVTALLKAAAALKDETGRDSLRLIMLLDECDHIYPHLPNAGYWASDFFAFWNSLQSIKRALDNPEQIVYVLSGVNPSGVEQGSLEGQPNPLYETQRIYLPPIDRPGANALLSTLGARMGLLFDEGALERTYELVGGHPILLRRLGSAIHSQFLNRAEKQLVSKLVIERTFERQKRDLFNQVIWFLEHLARVAPDEERLLRDIAQGGAQAYGELWGENEFRETYAYHLERYGLVRFENDFPEISLALVREALRKPPASEFAEQKRQLKDVVEAIEQSVRTRLRTDLERDRTPAEAAAMVVRAIPSDAKNRALDRAQLTELGDLAGLGAVLDSLNWGDFEILISKHHEQLVWAGASMPIGERLKFIKSIFVDAHLVRHNNDHELKAKIASLSYQVLLQRFTDAREMMSA